MGMLQGLIYEKAQATIEIKILSHSLYLGDVASHMCVGGGVCMCVMGWTASL